MTNEPSIATAPDAMHLPTRIFPTPEMPLTSLPLTRVRRVFLIGAIASTLVAAIHAMSADQPAAFRAGACLSALVLCASWTVGERRGGFSRMADAIELPALLVLLLVTPGDPFVPLFGLALRSLYGGLVGAAGRYVLWVSALLVAHWSRGIVQLRGDLARGVGLALVPLTLQLLTSAMQRLQSSERRLASLVQNSTDIVTVVGTDLVVTWQADSIGVMLGHRAQDVRGTSVLDLVAPGDRARLVAEVADVERDPALVRTVQVRLCHADGDDRDFEVIIANRLHDPYVAGLTLSMRDATEPRRLERELRRVASEREQEALHDPLTGLANRRMLFRDLDTAIATAERRSQPLALLILDLDGFKELNDTLGHHAGDELLAELGERLTSGVPEADLVARIGGDEFAVLFGRDASIATATGLARRIGELIERPMVLRGVAMRVQASVGIALYPEHAQNPMTMLQRADIAMYCAKGDGLGHAVYDAARDDYSTARLSLMAELPTAMCSDELVVLYQPKISFPTEQVCGAEALVRWQHPIHGMLAPDAFLALVERAGLMPALTLEVLDRSLAQSARWSAAGLDLGVAVNLAAANVMDIDFPRQVSRLLHRHGVAPAMLTLEVTETIVGGDSPQVLDVLMSLRELGVKLSLDDFGTGTSSLSFLRRLPVQELKIDKSFVLGMEEHPQDGAIVRTITQLAQDLGVAVVAEGIETTAVYERLRDGGCDGGQGFLIGRPASADRVTLLAQGGAPVA